MKLNNILVTLFFTLILGFLICDSIQRYNQSESIRMKYLKDSVEMEYYKKQLESYPYDHSEIKDTIKSNGRY